MTFENNTSDDGGRYYLIGEVVFDSERNVILRDGDIARLEPKIAALLKYFIDTPGRVHSKDALIAQIWAGVTVVEEVLPRAISLLRAHWATTCVIRRSSKLCQTKGIDSFPGHSF